MNFHLTKCKTWSSLLLLAWFLSGALLQAATYYVATNGSDSSDGLAPASLGGNSGPWATPAKASSVLVAGDTVFIRGGGYDGTVGTSSGMSFSPLNSGTATSPIICSNYPNETPVFFGNSQLPEHLCLRGVSYVKVFGLVFTNSGRMATLQSSTNCEVAYCTFTHLSPNGPAGTLFWVTSNSQRNWIHHNIMYDSVIGGQPAAWEAGNLFQVGYYNSVFRDFFNLIENNVFYWAGHDAVTLASGYCIFRNNYVHNEPWYRWQTFGCTNKLFGERCMEVGNGSLGWDRNVIEGNRLSYAGQPGSGDHGGAGLTTESRWTIFRRNEVIGAQNFGIECYTKWYSLCFSNYIYNNTVAFCGSAEHYTTNYCTNPPVVFDNTAYVGAIHLVSTTNNVWVNNIFYGNYGNTWFSSRFSTNWMAWDARQIRRSSFGSNNSPCEPLFLNSSGSDPFSTNAPNLQLSSLSPCIDAAEFLTTISSPSGSGTNFSVADPNFFYDGFGMVQGDRIQLAGQTNVAMILSVDYAAKIINFDTPLTWTIGLGVSLAFNGGGPDMGAHEAPWARSPTLPEVVTKPTAPLGLRRVP